MPGSLKGPLINKMEFGPTCRVCSRGPVDSTPSASLRPTSLICCHTAADPATAGEEGQLTIREDKKGPKLSNYPVAKG